MFVAPREAWYVVPAHVVVALVSRKHRGQHTENPFEPATPSLSSLDAYRVADVDLRRATLAAVESSALYPQLREAMGGVLQQSRELARRSKEEVRQLLRELGLDS